MNNGDEARLEAKLDRLFAAYRDAMPDRDASALFMPELWERIEARRASRWFVRMTRAVVAAGALAAMVLVVAPDLGEPGVESVTYVEALAHASTPERDLLLGVAHLHDPDGGAEEPGSQR
jgi:hypothetical protein